MISSKVLNTLEYDKILQSAANFAAGNAAKKAILRLTPYQTFKECATQLALTGEASAMLFTFLLNPMVGYDEMEEILQKTEVLSVLSLGELLRVARLLRAVRIAKHTIDGADGSIVLLKELVGNIIPNTMLEKKITDSVLSEEEISDNASEKLSQIRKGIRKCNFDIKDKLQSIIKSSNYQKYLQDSIVTVREGRYVVPVKQEYKGNISGLIHDQSASKATVFMEPIQVVELNNKLKTLQIEEQVEIEAILYDLTCAVSVFLKELSLDYQLLVTLDEIFSKALYADSIRAVRPVFVQNGQVKLKRVRHPLIAKDVVVPIDIELGTSFDVLVITGPNTGGKTVSIKTVGLFTLMAMSGMFIPAAEESSLSFFAQVFCDIGDEQSIENSLSTFSSHMKNITDICDHAGSDSLVLLDEVGAGTDPDEGAALAVAIIGHLLNAGCKMITTTHYGALKEFSMSEERVENASMEFDPDTFAPTYRMHIGIPGSSKALEIAQRLGLKPQIIATAKSCLSAEKLAFDRVLEEADRLIAETGREKTELEAKLKSVNEQTETLRKEREQLAVKQENLLKNAKAEARRIVAENLNEAESLVQEIKDMLKAETVSDANYFQANSKKRSLEDKLYNISKEEEQEDSGLKLKEFNSSLAAKGQKVYVKSLKNTGVLLDCREKKGTFSVAFGTITMNVKTSDLFLAEERKPVKKQAPRPSAPSVSVNRNVAPSRVQMEINLLGHTVMEAEPKVDAFLENAANCGLTEVKIIHGIGTGKLREGIHAMLRRHSLVKEFRLGRYGEGEGGVTIVTIV